MDCRTPSIPLPHQLPEFAQTHVHWVGDTIQPSHPLSSPSPPTFNLAQHQGLFQWISSSHQVAKVLELQLQHQSFQWIFGTDFFWKFHLVGSPCSPRDPQESSPTPQFQSTVMKHNFVISFNLEQSAFHLMLKSAGLQSSVSVSGSVSAHFCMTPCRLDIFLARTLHRCYCIPFTVVTGGSDAQDDLALLWPTLVSWLGLCPLSTVDKRALPFLCKW